MFGDNLPSVMEDKSYKGNNLNMILQSDYINA